MSIKKTARRSTHLTRARFEFHSLGWNSFQQLCLTVTSEVLGQTVESFLDSRDGGRDGAFAGRWIRKKSEDLAGQFVLQCKFTSRPDHHLKPSDVTDEARKLRRLVDKGQCDIYVLLTNSGLSGVQAERIEEMFRAAGAKHVLLLESTWLARQIYENKRLRMLVPRVYGLGDLSQILDERAYEQAQAILESMREDLARVVVTDAYRRAASALDRRGFALLVGEPAAGKTTIASLLAMAAIDQWDASVLKLDKPARVTRHWNPSEPSQFFWLDDAFGVAQYEASTVREWNHILPQVNSMLRRGAKIVMTSRDYIYNRARTELKRSAFPLLDENQVVIDVRDLSIDERQQILYNHLRLGRQPRSFLSAIKPHLEFVAAHPQFIPETARRLGDPFFIGGDRTSRNHLDEFVERRERFLQDVLEGLDTHSRSALALIYMRSDRLDSPIQLEASEEQAIDRLGSSLGHCLSALEALKGSLVLHQQVGDESIWRFKHPTIGDAFATLLVRSPELLNIFVQGSAPDKLAEQVTCGDVGIEKSVVLPRTLFPLMIKKLRTLQSRQFKDDALASWRSRSDLQNFLARRCSKEFLAIYLKEHPELLAEVSIPGLYLHAVSEVELAARLHQFGLLPEGNRRTFVETVSKYALDGEDVYALEDRRIRSVFTSGEFEEFRRRVRLELLPNLADARRNWEINHPSEQPAEEYMQQFLDALGTLRTQFGKDAEAVKAIDREEELANQWIADNAGTDSSWEPRNLGRVKKAEKPLSARSIFEDIDA